MAETRPSLVGRPMKRVEDPRLLKGIGTYTDDLRLPGMLHAMILRSPHESFRSRPVKTDTTPGIAAAAAVSIRRTWAWA